MPTVHMRVFEHRKLLGERVLSGWQFERCEFTGCHLADFDTTTLGMVFRDGQLSRCTVRNSAIQGAFLDEIVVKDLKVSGRLILHACVLRHVKLEGKIGGFLVATPNPALGKDKVAALRDAVVARYADIDWALDISDADLGDVDLYYMPGDKIRRNPEKHYLVRRATFAGVDLGDLRPYARGAVQRFESTPFDSIVAVAPRGLKHSAAYREDLDWLRDQGLAE